mmetsp:Transcript_44354/g.70975  ORF Transcript_44354/g.70975 Transcript_44354/m.70975 type:complete len:216 (-) Transcript_44354:200-847(-)
MLKFYTELFRTLHSGLSLLAFSKKLLGTFLGLCLPGQSKFTLACLELFLLTLGFLCKTFFFGENRSKTGLGRIFNLFLFLRNILLKMPVLFCNCLLQLHPLVPLPFKLTTNLVTFLRKHGSLSCLFSSPSRSIGSFPFPLCCNSLCLCLLHCNSLQICISRVDRKWVFQLVTLMRTRGGRRLGLSTIALIRLTPFKAFFILPPRWSQNGVAFWKV